MSVSPFASINCNFSEALKKMCEKNLFEAYDYENCADNVLFSEIREAFEITEVVEINNPQLYEMYLLWKEELQNSDLYPSGTIQEKPLYHATSRYNAQRIAEVNIDWRKTYRSKFGVGTCFSPHPRVAHHYASAKGAFIIFDVLIKNIETNIRWESQIRVPTQKEYDTTLSSYLDTYVKYDDYHMYPKFIVYYLYNFSKNYLQVK